jgi:hypothetical protein
MIRYIFLVYILSRRQGVGSSIGPIFQQLAQQHLDLAVMPMLIERIRQVFMMSSQLRLIPPHPGCTPGHVWNSVPSLCFDRATDWMILLVSERLRIREWTKAATPEHRDPAFSVFGAFSPQLWGIAWGVTLKSTGKTA